MMSEDVPVPAPANPGPKSVAIARAVIGSLLLWGLAEPNLLTISSPRMIQEPGDQLDEDAKAFLRGVEDS